MKILLHSNAPWAPTGYGNQCGLFAPRLAEHHDLAVSAFYGLEGAPLNWNGVPVLPGLGGSYGNESILDHARHFFGGPKDGLVLTLLDVWVLAHQVIREMNVASWVPVDHDPAPPGVARFFHESGSVPIAMSRFGEEKLAGFDPLHYVPHGVDTNVFKPSEPVRDQMGVPDDGFVVGMVAANKGRPSRKGFVQGIRAFAKLRERHEDAYLYLHTSMSPAFAQGEDLGAILAACQVPIEAVKLAEQYRMQFAPFGSETMAQIYSSMDVLLNPAFGEGFGIPVIEAQACGVPVIVTDFSAMSEVCGAGWKVDSDKEWTGQLAWQARPMVNDIAESLTHAYLMPPAQRKKLAEKARKHALEYDADRVMTDYFLPVLEQIEERIGEPELEAVA